ncbi:hypothetical protein HDV00_003974 [Rhizophlyctis rosea]|nr:hypothetical protein HDV00_003974 [Rhizophlyctis rosea]
MSEGIVLGILCATRLIIGFGTGTLSVCKAYLAANCEIEERTKVVAWSGMAQYAGFSLTPILATFLTSITSWVQGLPSTDNTFLACIVPGIALAIANILLVPLLLFCMPAKDPCTTADRSSPDSKPKPTTTERPLNIKTSDSPSTRDLSSPSSLESANPLETSTTDQTIRYGFYLFFLLNFVLRGIIGLAETLAPNTYAYLRADVPNLTQSSGQFFFYLGLVGLAIFLIIDPLEKRLLSGDKLLILGTVAYSRSLPDTHYVVHIPDLCGGPDAHLVPRLAHLPNSYTVDVFKDVREKTAGGDD